jgi:uncharacterized protein YegP (UPF0339 family)
MKDGRKGIHVFRKDSLFGRRWYFNGKSGNSQIVAGSEAYNSRDAVYNGIRALAIVFGVAPNTLTIYEDGMRRDAYGRPMD